ncbi:MAG TPA: AAA family ATPase [Candidatus Kapabacteria bacterium]|nr:AAA family ATPase [Candidatus Kapabacteria bacterium]
MFVGRTEELSVLNAHYQKMLSGEGSIFFLTGEAGLGKTTLVHEWWKSLAASGGELAPLFAEAACSIPIANMNVADLEALQPWADIIAQLQQIEIKDTTKKKLDLKKIIHETAPTWAWALPFVGDIAHAALETSRLIKEQKGSVGSTQGAANQQQVFQQYESILKRIAEHRPLVIFLDDMHWSDAASVNLLFYLMRNIKTMRIFIIVTYRPDEASALDDGKGHPIIKVKNEVFRYSAGAELQLPSLGEKEISALMKELFPGYQSDTVFEKWLRKISDGISLFVTQFIRILQEQGFLDGHGAFHGRYEDVTVSISAVALAVVDERTRRLDSETRELLRYGTVEGEEFTSYILARMTGKKPLELLKELRKAEGVGVIRCTGTTRMFGSQTAMTYAYTHTLFYQALYNSLNDQEKEILNRECFEAMKELWEQPKDTGRAAALAPKLIDHAVKCGETAYATEVQKELERLPEKTNIIG